MSAILRRDFLKGLLGAGISASLFSGRALAESPSPNPPSRPALADAPEQLAALTEVDVVIIGSGYGGAIAAARLANQVGSLVVLERGREWHPGDFPTTPLEGLNALHQNTHKQKNPLGLFHINRGAGMNIICGSGLGGTSLINAGVALRPRPDIFEDERWPNGLGYSQLAPYYAQAEVMLAVGRTPGGLSRFAKTRVLAQGAVASSVPIEVVPICVNTVVGGETPGTSPMPNAEGVLQTRCTACGDCMTGCNFGSKNTIDTNYLPLAKRNGARIFTQTEVTAFTRLEDGRYRIDYLRRSNGGNDPGFTGSLVAKALILSAGTLGSTELMLRSQRAGMAFSSLLGRRFSANGDLISLNYNGSKRTEIDGIGTRTPRANQQGECGPTVVSAVRLDSIEGSHPCVVEDLSMPSLVAAAAARPLALLFGAKFDRGGSAVGRALADILPSRNSRGALAQSMVTIALGTDGADGQIALDNEGDASVVWPAVAQEPAFSQLSDWMGKLTAVTSGIYRTLTQWLTLDGRVGGKGSNNLLTAHPLGGCVMADSVEQGVVDSRGRVFDANRPAAVYPGLYVCDGSIVPTPLGVNPLLTISALAEHIAAEILKQDGELIGAR